MSGLEPAEQPCVPGGEQCQLDAHTTSASALPVPYSIKRHGVTLSNCDDEPVQTPGGIQAHGMLLVLSFVGTVIALERSVALNKAPGYASPALLGIAGLLLISPLELWIGKTTMLAGTIAMTLVYIPLWRRQYDNVVLIQILGALRAVILMGKL